MGGFQTSVCLLLTLKRSLLHSVRLTKTLTLLLAFLFLQFLFDTFISLIKKGKDANIVSVMPQKPYSAPRAQVQYFNSFTCFHLFSLLFKPFEQQMPVHCKISVTHLLLFCGFSCFKCRCRKCWSWVLVDCPSGRPESLTILALRPLRL